MLNDIVGIKISGANYTTDTDLKIFDSKDDNSNKSKIVKGTIIYGRNGSGKSTIAKGFKKLVGEDIQTINKSEFFDIDNKNVIINDTEAASIGDYFENLMYRLVLHGGSHREEQARNLEIDFYSLISEEEKKRTAKDVISFIYLLNPQHIISHLSDSDKPTLEKWCNDILSE